MARVQCSMMMRTKTYLLRVALLASGAVWACSSSSQPDKSSSNSSSSSSDGTTISCESEPRDVYVANLQKTGQSTALTFVLAESIPAPPAKGRNTWTVRVLDPRNGTAIAGATISAMAFMPAHGHSASNPIVVTPTSNNTAAYTIAPITLFMPGLWEVTLDADANGVRDRVVFKLCVAG